ncbi:MAG: TonB-dependent receptor [Bacteroidota bacterium]
MKKRVLWLRYLFLFFAFVSASVAFAQELTITGKVTDAADGSTIPGVTVVVKGTSTGAVTDIDGHYSLKAKAGDVLVFSYVGYTSQEITVAAKTEINVVLATGVKSLNEVIVIGYGTVKKGDATGSVQALDKKDFNQGAISSPQQLIIGKIPGVQVTSYGGAPGGDAVIRIRGGASINASNDPLIILDGVPLDDNGISGSRGTLGMLNPDDIETYTVLKDASATAIYGSRASNGVILITTKKGKAGSGAGGKNWNLEYSGNISLYTVPKTYDVLNGDEFRALINSRYSAAKDSNIRKLLSPYPGQNYNFAGTDWQNQIYRSALSTDHNISVTGVAATMPYRLSVGYYYQDGTLRTDNLKRTTVGVNLSPSFFKNYLKFNINAKYLYEKNRFANTGAIGAAISFDPTKPVHANNRYGNYWSWLQQPGDTLPVAQASGNPVGLLELRDDQSHVGRFIGNAQIDYKLHFLPDLKATLNLGMDYSKASGTLFVPANASWEYSNKGTDNVWGQTKKNSVLDFYLTYIKDVKSISSKFEVMAGYSWQHFYMDPTYTNNNVPHDSLITKFGNPKKEYYLVSFYGRLNYTLLNRYLLTFTLRDDGSSKFSKDNRWGLFPSVALAWKINDEAFLKNSKVISQLKLRLGWGNTGQQNISDSWYPYIPTYTQSDQFSMYQLGNIWYTTLRAGGYDPNIKWEVTTTYNVGLDLGFLNDRITGAIDYYIRKTSDILLWSPVPAGTNLTNYIYTNIGDMENRGFEFALGGKPIVSKDWKWDLNVNATKNVNKITKLSIIDDPTYPGIPVGLISGGVGNNIQIHSVNFPANSFYVYQQVYDASGKPVEGLYVDRNGDGKINEKDLYRYKSPNPDWTFGIFTTVDYKKWTLSTAGHASVGNYIYNNVSATRGVYSNLYRNEGPYLGNVTRDVYDVNFENPQYLSDYYVQNGSFFKLDYLTLAYSFGNVTKNTANLKVSFTMNNVFTITKYKGLDPEVFQGIDNNLYPRSRVFVLGVNLLF